MAQQLKTKNIKIVPGQLFCRQCKTKLLLEKLTVLMIKINLNLLQILTMNSVNIKHQEKAPINWHFTCQLTLIYEKFKEEYFRSIKSAS